MSDNLKAQQEAGEKVDGFSTIKKRSVIIAGYKTSISLEPEFWDRLKHVVERDKTTISAFLNAIREANPGKNLSSLVRVHLLQDALR